MMRDLRNIHSELQQAEVTYKAFDLNTMLVALSLHTIGHFSITSAARLLNRSFTRSAALDFTLVHRADCCFTTC